MINGRTENYKRDPSQAQWLTVEINNNLLVTFFFISLFIYFSLACALKGAERDEEQGRGQDEGSVWPWKLIKNRCSDNHIKVMEAFRACEGSFVCASVTIDC